MRNQIPKAIRDRAERMELDRADLERTGIRAARALGRSVRLAGLRAYRSGGDVFRATREELVKITPLLLDGAVAGHLKGRARATDTITELYADAPVSLSTAYGKSLRFLLDAQDLGPKDLAKLRELYGESVTDQVQLLSTAVDRRLQSTLRRISFEGLNKKDGIAAISNAYSALGLTPENSYTFENIFRTQVQTAYAAGRWNVLNSPDIADIVWGFQYVTVGDNRVRASHIAMDGVRLPKGDPFWARAFPPNGFSCRCAAVEIFHDDPDAKPLVPDSATILPGSDTPKGKAGKKKKRPADRPKNPPAEIPPEPKVIDGAVVQPEPEAGHETNPGARFPDGIGKPRGVEANPATAMIDFGSQTKASSVSKKRAAELTREATASMEAIDRVHGVNGIPPLPVKYNGRARSFGVYYASKSRGGWFEFSAKGKVPRMTVAHELGHYIDHMGLSGTGHKGKFSSNAPRDAEEGIPKLMRALSESRAVRAIRERRKASKSSQSRKYDLYLLQGHEQFARAYSQYIAVRSGDAKMLEELGLSDMIFGEHAQWDDDDFEPIAAAFDDLFRSKGWLRQR